MSSLRYLFSGKARNVLPIQNKSLSGGATVCFKNVLAHIKCTVFSFAVSGLPNHWRYVIITYGGIRTRVKGGLKVHKEDLNLIDHEFSRLSRLPSAKSFRHTLWKILVHRSEFRHYPKQLYNHILPIKNCFFTEKKLRT